MWGCHLCLIWTFDGWRFGISVTRSWISFNMKGCLFFEVRKSCWQEGKMFEGAKVKRKSYGGQKERETTHACGSEEKPRRGFGSLYLNLLMLKWEAVLLLLLLLQRGSRNYPKNRSGRKNSLIASPIVEIFIRQEEGGQRPWQIQDTVCHCVCVLARMRACLFALSERTP